MCLFFFNDTATPEIYTLSLHDALPISRDHEPLDLARPLVDLGDLRVAVVALDGELLRVAVAAQDLDRLGRLAARQDRKSTRLNSSHANISYAVFCLKKNNEGRQQEPQR